ncbi:MULTISPECIES: lysophospholipid acyltransferase family protein [Thermocrispum]|uniref:1-acyl-sn-glycerol-3-phosphate acyltransferase n=1 Tax=Thermocrispum agreste TaxID=37925 RepID=A0A2W4LTW1_9PSEU|nr:MULTISPECIES: lysophospholipid acyltransferase family protein [Thermocrispum]PZN01124.1 MAG: 1-acyl-sn-glycerol-3-phosphate acyltransferase [Thermocrispum agreste]
MSDTGLPAGASPLLHDVARVIARHLYRPAYRIRVHHADRVPPSGPVLLVANHMSLIEPQLIFGFVPRRPVFLVKQELFDTLGGVTGVLLRKLGQLPVRRGEPDRTPLLDAVRLLRSGGLVAVFPEGTRGSGNVEKAEHGAAWLVRASGARVVPVAARGTARPPGGRRRFRPTVDLLFGEPFTLDVPRGRDGLRSGTETVRTRLAATVAELDEWRAGAGGAAPGRSEAR